ncbi:hypothetical protein PYCCODRAFT_1469602 [Trametes coccinea BRFM310]|uniref:Fungal-type protein kinase domain-containing protein n=1 Tax=Trametes coccinea (strain BRFM310) TaxID=1353009 RepID=A0A1Y2IK42_TRAC3|nr:hypothetical protein PYCCODRAFT_1469602 [Trametes coccinea BRFM310]
MAGKIVLLSFEEFLEKFVPAPEGESEPVDQFKAADFSTIPHRGESDMYEPLTAAFNQDWLLPHDVAVATPNKGDADVASMQKIDGGLYRHNDAPDDSTRWSSIELSIECKTEPTQQDPLDDSSLGPEAGSIKRKDVLGQIMCYAVLVFDNQQRTHHFTLLMLGHMARIMRWDRAGLLATKKFDYTKKPEYLAQFLWRFGRMTPEQRGHDPTAQRVLPGSDDYKLMHERAERLMKAPDGTIVGEHAREMFKNSLFLRAPLKDDPVNQVILGPAALWRLTVHGSSGHRDFLVGLPHTTAGTLAGRGTRTYVAIDAAHLDGPFVYLKDAWRVDHQGIEQEGKILAILNDGTGGGPVRAVPTLRCHGDVGDQVTRSQKVWQEKHPDIKPEDCPLKTHRHYRLVVDEVCRPLREFDMFLDLVVVIHDCIEAHGHAYRRKGLLHRDISAGNVLIYPKPVVTDNGTLEDPVGILADWELAKKVEEPNAKNAPRQPDRTGTWQFTSAMALDNPKKRIVVQDDMESFFHLLLYYAIRFLPHNCPNVGDFMDQYFDGQREENGVYYGGVLKLSAMRTGALTVFGGDALKFYTTEEYASPKVGSACGQEGGSEDPRICPGTATEVLPDSSSSTSALSCGNAATAQEADDHLELHPINSLLSDFLARIKAHYVLYYTPRKTVKAKPATGVARTSFSKPSTSTARRTRLQFRVADDSDEESDQASSSEILEATLSAQGNKLLEGVAAKLGDHKEMKKLFSRHIRKKGWPTDDRVADQLPKKYRRNMETARGTKRTHETADLGTAEPQSKRSCSMR